MTSFTCFYCDSKIYLILFIYRLKDANSRSWILINGKEGSLIYADKRVDTSCHKQLLTELKGSELTQEKAAL